MLSMPKVTIAFLSWNRLEYLRPTIQSARECIQYPNLEWIISDNDSNEKGLQDFLKKCGWVDRIIVKKQSHPAAMNEIVELAQGKYLILWPDDMQFIVKGEWLSDLVEILENNQWIGSVALNAFRCCTLKQLFGPTHIYELWNIWTEFRRLKSSYRRSQRLLSSRDFPVRTVGRRMPGIFGCGIPGLTRVDIWRKLGPWREKKYGVELRDSSNGAEGDMVNRFNLSGMPLQTALLEMPVAADIITDPLGCKAKVRKNLRYGVYMPPVDPCGYYYKIHEQAVILKNSQSSKIRDFSEIVQPLGFTVPVDENGDHLKTSINTSIVFDCESNQLVPFPLQNVRKEK